MLLRRSYQLFNMTLVELAQQLTSLDDCDTIFAERIAGEFSPHSRAVVLALSEAEQDEPVVNVAARRCPGFEYCLEISLSKDAVRVWSQWRNDKAPSPLQAAEAICHKANHDAWGPPIA
jgi:hypothetical protein